jgi:hypothetical protein
MKYLETLWESYRKTIPANTSSVQIAAAQMDFYCGATAMFSNLVRAVNDEMPKEVGMLMMSDITEEIEEFLNRLTPMNRQDKPMDTTSNAS